MFFKKKKKKVIFILFGVLFIFLALYSSFGLIIEKNLNTDDLEKILSEKTGLEYKISEPKFKTSFDLGFSAQFKEFSVFIPQRDSAVIDLKNPKMKISILPLIFGNIVLREFSSDDIYSSLKIEENGKLEILKYLVCDKNTKVKFKNADISLGKYNFDLVDLYNKSNLSIVGDFLNLSKFNPEKYVDLKTKGLFLLNGKKSFYDIDFSSKLPIVSHLNSKDFDINVKIKDFDITPLGLYFKNNGILSSSGIINADITTKKDENNESHLKITMDKIIVQGKDFLIKKLSPIDISSDFVLEKNNLEIKNLEFNSQNINIVANGLIKKISSRKPGCDLNLEFLDTQLNDIIALVPENLDITPEKSLAKLKKYNAHGKLNGKLNIKGKMPEPLLYGKIDITDVFIVEKKSFMPYSYGNVEFSGDKTQVDVTARASVREEVYIKGFSELYGKQYGEYKITSTDNVDLETTQFVLCPVRDIIGFKLGPVPIMKIKGLGSIDINVQGTLEESKINGFFKFKNTKATIEGFNDWLTDASGKIDFKGVDFFFTDWKAKLLGSDVKIGGKANTYGMFNMNFDIFALELSNALRISRTSDIAKNFITGVEYIKNPKGKIDFLLELSGEMFDFTKEELMNSLKPKGIIKLYNNSIAVDKTDLEINSINGKIGFGEKIEPNISAKVYNSPFSINGSLEQSGNYQRADLTFKSGKIKSSDIYKILNVQNSFLDKNIYYLSSDLNITGNIPLNLEKIKSDDFKINGVVKGVNSADSPIRFESGMLKLNGKDGYIDNLEIKYFNSLLSVKGNIKNILSANIKPNIDVSMKDFDLETLLSSLSLSKNVRISEDITEFKGTLSGQFSVRGNDFKGSITPNKISFYLKPKKCYVSLKSGNVLLDSRSLKLKAFNILLDNTPMYVDAAINNFLSNRPHIDAKFSSNIDSVTLDKFVNTNLTYPIKLIGEAGFSGRLFGYSDNYTIDSSLMLDKGVDLEYMGANFGDTEVKRRISANTTFEKNAAKINNAKYEKFVLSQNNKENSLPMIQANGLITIGDDDVHFKNLKIKTLNPTTAKIFNLAFKKSILKKGLFDCDLAINGSSKNLQLIGGAEFRDLNIPLYDLEVQGASLNFNKEVTDATFKLKSYNSDVLVKAKALNNFTLPVVIKELDIKSDTINLSKILAEFSETSRVQKTQTGSSNLQNIVLNPKDIIIERGLIDAKKLLFDGVEAKNLRGEFSQNKDGIFNVDDVVFDIAGGRIKSNGSFNFSNVSLEFYSKMENCDADTLVSSLFNTPGQLYGTMNGKISFSGKNLNTKESINTIKSNADFEIINGKMPKLGSLEYLLRAGNFYKSGILGFTLNNLIEVLNPYKTGEFKSIKGRISMHEGVMDNIEIYSKGENLSIFLNGSYDLPQRNADIFVFGRLSRKVSSVLGVAGNASLNSILNVFTPKDKNVSDNEIIQNINKIPLIEINNDDFRLFSARIKGDLNKENYVKAFNWLN